MLEVIKKSIRKGLGNLFGFVLFHLFGKNLLLKKLDETKILSIYFHNPSIEVFEVIINWLVKYDFNIITHYHDSSTPLSSSSSSISTTMTTLNL